MGHSVQTIRLAGGHSVLDFLNTVDPGRVGADRDVLYSFEEDVEWARRVDVIAPTEARQLREQARKSAEEAADSHLRLLNARDVIRAAVASEVAKTSLDTDDGAVLTALADSAMALRHFSQVAGRFAWRWDNCGLDLISHRLIFAATELLTDQRRRPMKVCAAETCGWYFLDTSKSGRRRWCSDAVCGSLARVRRLRQRRRA